MQNETTIPASGKRTHEWMFWIILMIPFLYIPLIWNKLPESIPTHWNFQGEPDHFSSKGYGTLFLPFLNIGLYFLMRWLPKLDPRKRNYTYFGNSYRSI